MHGSSKKKIDRIAGSAEFDRLLGRLVHVPKAEIEAEETKYKAMRKPQEKKVKRRKDES